MYVYEYMLYIYIYICIHNVYARIQWKMCMSALKKYHGVLYFREFENFKKNEILQPTQRTSTYLISAITSKVRNLGNTPPCMIHLSSSCPEVFVLVEVSEFPSATFQGRVDIIPTPKESDLSMRGLLFRNKVTKFLGVFVVRSYDRYEKSRPFSRQESNKN